MGLRMRAFGGIQEGDRRDSNPCSAEPQSANACFSILPYGAEWAYLSSFLCWRLPVVSACSALSGVRSGVKDRVSSHHTSGS